MSWFDTAGIASFAKSALNTAQKTIDKALDIQEEKANQDNFSKKLETDNFFEAFGLSDKSSSQANIISDNPQPSTSELHPQATTAASAVQISGFWSDTWGSFFELKGSSSKSEFKKESSDPEPSESNSKQSNAVLSQPIRASLFPSDTAHPVSQGTPTEDSACVVNEDITENVKEKENIKYESVACDVDVKKEKCSASESLSENASPDSYDIKEEPSLPSKRTVEENLEDNKCNESNLPILENIVVSDVNATEDTVTLSNTSVGASERDRKDMIESEYFSISMTNTSSNTNKKIESEYDIVDMAESELSSNTMETSSDSFTRSASVEVMSSSSQYSYNISNSTLEIPDLPENMVSWEWGNVSEDICVRNSKTKNFKIPSENVEGSVKSPESSFHTITASSFSDNHAWIKSDKSSQFNDESPNSSNEEHDSHHTDESSNSSKDDGTDTPEAKDYDIKSSCSNESHATSSSSFIKCSADDNDSCSHRGPSPVSTTASERSDILKHESEQNTSGDENETATSSDIEILSPPNGENGDRNISPLKHIWMPRPLRLRRSESPTSDSSKDSMMPVVSELEERIGNESTAHFSKEERSHRKVNAEDHDLKNLLQKQEELQSVLDEREKKVLELNKENIELQENEQRLKNLIQKMRVEQAKELRDIAALTKEFTQRLSLVEGQLKETVKERDKLQIELQEAKIEISKRICASDIEEVMKDKDIQIKELTEEGQKLAKKELQHMTIIKKLRAKEEEMDKTIKSQAEKLESNSKEVERLRISIGAKEEQEKKHIDAIRQLTNNVKKLEKEVASLKSNLEDATEKELSLKKSLDSTYKDLTDLRKSYEMKEKELEEFKSGLEVEANENLIQMLESSNKEAAKEKEMLLLQIQELRCTLSRSEEEANLREKMFKADIASLQKRLQEAEERNEDLTKNMSSATRPLVRQIENLQATYNTQTLSWEKIEKNLTDRLSDAQNQLALMGEKERSATEKYIEYQSRVTALETQNNTLRQEKLHLASEIESLKAQIIMLEETKTRDSYALEKLKSNYEAEIERLKMEKADVEKTMSTCLEMLDDEKKKVRKLEEEIKLKETRALILSGTSRSSSPTGSVRSSVSSIHNWSQDEIQDQGTSTPVNHYRMSVYESLRLGSGSSLIENLQSQLKQREGEIMQLQFEITKLEQVKESMTKELVQLSEQNEQHETKLHMLEAVEKEFKDLDQKYNTLLQMYGEKVEQTEELQLDLEDVKSMYKAQIEELLRNK